MLCAAEYRAAVMDAADRRAAPLPALVAPPLHKQHAAAPLAPSVRAAAEPSGGPADLAGADAKAVHMRHTRLPAGALCGVGPE